MRISIKKINYYFLISSILFLMPINMFLFKGIAFGTEDFTLKKKISIDAEEDLEEEDEDDEEEEFEFSFSGFIELENFISTYTNQEFKDIFKKEELRCKLDFQAGTESLYVKVVPNIYLIPNIKGIHDDYLYDPEKFRAYRNGRLSGHFYEISFNELYVNYSTELFRLRGGNQIYAWGTADVFNPTRYFNPMDSREMVFKDQDETILGIPSISNIFFIKDFTLELVFVPFHVTSIAPVRDNYWAYEYRQEFIVMIEDDIEPLDIHPKNFAYGGRFAASIRGFDFSLSSFYGSDRDPVTRPLGILLVANELPVQVALEYYRVANIGFDFSFTLWKFVFQGELVYSPNKHGVVDEDVSNISAGTGDLFPFAVEKSHYVSYSAGANLIWDDLNVTIEWTQSLFFNKNLMDPLFSDLVSIMIEDQFFESKLKLALMTVIDTKNSGFMMKPLIGYNFQNGFTLEMSYAFLYGKGGDGAMDVFSLYKDKDIITLKARYEF